MIRTGPLARVLLIAAGVLLLGPARALAQKTSDIAVIVNPAVPVDSLTLPELVRLLLGDREYWPSSVRVTLLIRAPVAREREVVIKDVCKMTEAQFRQHWIAKVFRAETPSAPKIVYSSEMALDMVGKIPGGMTFVQAAQVGRGLKVVRIEGRLPGEPGYPLHEP